MPIPSGLGSEGGKSSAKLKLEELIEPTNTVANVAINNFVNLAMSNF